MDDFTIYGDSFEEALENIENVLIQYLETYLCLCDEKSKMFLTKGDIPRHNFSIVEIEVRPKKLESLLKIGAPTNQKEE